LGDAVGSGVEEGTGGGLASSLLGAVCLFLLWPFPGWCSLICILFQMPLKHLSHHFQVLPLNSVISGSFIFFGGGLFSFVDAGGVGVADFPLQQQGLGN
jgi:hypothetical protein